MTDYPCIVCGKPRADGRIWCGDDACLQVVLKMPTEELNAIRQRESLEALRRAPADGRGAYIHITPRNCVRCKQPITAGDKTEPYTFPSDGRIVHSKCVGELIREVLSLMANVPDGE